MEKQVSKTYNDILENSQRSVKLEQFNIQTLANSGKKSYAQKSQVGVQNRPKLG